MCALLISVITLSGAANRSFRTEMEQWNPIGFTQASNGITQAQAGAQTTNRLTAGNAILPTVATAAPSGVLRDGSTNVITFTTAKADGEKITLNMDYTGAAPTLSGLTGTPESGKWITYTLTSQTVTITGDVTYFTCPNNQLTTLDVSQNTALENLWCTDNQLTTLDVSQNIALTGLYCYNNQLTALDVSKNTALTVLDCYNNQLTALDVSQNTSLIWFSCTGNQIKGEEMTRLVNSLPDRTRKNGGEFIVVQEPDLEGNICLKSDVAIAKGKNWITKKYNSDIEAYVAYEGEEPIPYAVTLTKEGEGTLTATGAADLTAVPEGIELTIEATPAEGYELTALTANGTDILATKKFTVRANTEVKAIFAKTYAVTLTNKGEGTLTATGADNLNAVPEGTELTIEATPAEGYELKALTANGTDILATKKFTVTADTEVKATFTKKTYAVTLTKEGEGTLTATGADDLNAVPYGTELTIEATPAAGYELKALTANGADILATKKVVVTAATTVKATFTKKTYAVTLTKEGEGTLAATGADDLNAVAYGTELTIVATPAEGYELTSLTANDTDILATKKVVVKKATEVKATFAKKTFAVTLTKEGEGTLAATGADDLNAVAYGTELTIVATPAEGYELTSLTANDTDILATKKVVVKKATEVKATFAKKTFAVTLTKEGEGTLTATGAADLNAVPEGTELTIEAIPAAGYELKALTANGTDILATKKVVVKEATEVKATFAKKTAADRVEAGSVRLYPNPASTYVNVKATKADALVRLYDANGTLLYEARTDDHGMLQIELSAYAEGTYLLLVDGNAQRLLIQR